MEIAPTDERGWSVEYFSAGELAGTAAPSGPSPVVQEAVGTPAVCEPAALRAAGAAGLRVHGFPRSLEPDCAYRRVCHLLAAALNGDERQGFGSAD